MLFFYYRVKCDAFEASVGLTPHHGGRGEGEMYIDIKEYRPTSTLRLMHGIDSYVFNPIKDIPLAAVATARKGMAILLCKYSQKNLIGIGRCNEYCLIKY